MTFYLLMDDHLKIDWLCTRSFSGQSEEFRFLCCQDEILWIDIFSVEIVLIACTRACEREKTGNGLFTLTAPFDRIHNSIGTQDTFHLLLETWDDEIHCSESERDHLLIQFQ
jgi:hypothetical protein